MKQRQHGKMQKCKIIYLESYLNAGPSNNLFYVILVSLFTSNMGFKVT